MPQNCASCGNFHLFDYSKCCKVLISLIDCSLFWHLYNLVNNWRSVSFGEIYRQENQLVARFYLAVIDKKQNIDVSTFYDKCQFNFLHFPNKIDYFLYFIS